MNDRVRRVLEMLAVIGLLVVALIAANREFAVVRVAGGSMQPSLASGDICLVRRGSAATTGAVVLVHERGRSPVLHRCEGISDDGVVLRGDANPVPDLAPVAPGSVVGAVVAVLPAGRVLERWRGHVPGDTIANQSNSTMR